MGTPHTTINYDDPAENQQPRRPLVHRRNAKRVVAAMRRDAESSYREGNVQAMLDRLDDVEFYTHEALGRRSSRF